MRPMKRNEGNRDMNAPKHPSSFVTGSPEHVAYEEGAARLFRSALAFQATGDETEIFRADDDNATPVALVPFPDGQAIEEHQALVHVLSEAPAMLEALRNVAAIWRKGEAIGHNAPEAAAIRAILTRIEGGGHG